MRSTLRLTEKQVLTALRNAEESEESYHDIYRIQPSRDALSAMKKPDQVFRFLA